MVFTARVMDQIGKYKILEKIGVGGFGAVYKGYDPFIKRHVAVKTCNTNDPHIRERFFQEAEISGNLHHRNVTTIFDFGLHDDLPYLIQEYLSGEDLDRKIKRRDPLPYAQKLDYLLQIARGLGHAHSRGVIHRDIKPANIRILEDGTAKIMDFGIAKLAQQETGLTQTGMTLGTAAYLAPEQIRGESADRPTDIFSFGVLAYELLTYERPFRGKQISAVLYEILHSQPKPILELWPEAPPEIVELLDCCLHKEPAERCADGTDLLRALQTIQGQSQSREAAAPGPVSAASAGVDAATPPATLRTPSSPTDVTLLSPPADPGMILPDVAPTAATIASPTAVTIATPVAPAAAGGLDQIEYAVTGGKPRATTATAPRLPQPARGPRFNILGGAILVVLAVAALAGGWWLGERGKQTAAATTPPAATAPPVVTPEPVPGPIDENPMEPVSGELAADETPAEPAVELAADTTGTTTETTTEPVPVEPADAAPPPPAPGVVVLPAVTWTDAMTVRVGNRTYPLTQPRRIELPPGSHTADFALETDGYSDRASAVFELTSGGRHALAIPIPQPGALSVRALPGRPQGLLSIDGEDVGPTPITDLRRRPGAYALEIRPLEGDAEGLARELRIEPGQEHILSFDLAEQAIRDVTRPLEP